MNDSNDSAKLVQPTDSNKEELSENPIEDNDIYMNEQCTPNIPVDQLDSFIAEKRSKGNEGFKKEYAVWSNWSFQKIGIRHESVFEQFFMTCNAELFNVNTTQTPF